MLSPEELSVIRSKALREWYQTPAGLAVREKRRKAMTNNSFALDHRDTEEQRERKSEGQKRRVHDPSQWAKAVEARRGCYVPPEERARISAMNTGNKYHFGYRHTQSDEARQKKSVAAKRNWSNETFRDFVVRRTLEAAKIRPTKPEIAVLGMLHEIAPDEWKYVGDGQVIICGKNPDIVNVNGRKAAILVHGIYWHLSRFLKKRPELTREQVEREDRQFYKTYGWDTLVIWEDELQKTEKLTIKIREFCRK